MNFKPFSAGFLLTIFTLGFCIESSWAESNTCKTGSLVVLGDSLVAGYGLNPGESFPDQLGKSLSEKGHSVTMINAGVSGDTSSGGLARLEWSVPEDARFVIVELGANDALRGISPEVTRSNLDEIVSTLKDKGAKVLLAGMMAPPNMGPQYADEFNAIYPALAEKYGTIFYPFFLEGVAAVERLNQADGIHPNAEGISIMVGNFLPYAERLLERGCE